MYRVSATTMESFRRVVETEHGNEQELMASVRGETFPMPWYVHAGSAWDAVLSSAARICKSGDYSFAPEAVVESVKVIGPGLCQVKATRAYETAYGPTTIVAKADHARGLIVTDNKFKASTPDARDYESSLQWRIYLAVHEAACFRYLLYDFADPKEGFCELKNILTFRFWPYAGLEDDVQRWLNVFLGWCESHKLLACLERAGTP